MTYSKLHQTDDVSSTSEMSVIAVSYHIDTNRLDTSVITCPITPHLFPLFKLVDDYLHTCHNMVATPSMDEMPLSTVIIRSGLRVLASSTISGVKP